MYYSKTREELNDTNRALSLIEDGHSYTVSVSFGHTRDPASGRSEWYSVELRSVPRSLVIEHLRAKSQQLSKQLAKELREAADKLDGKVELPPDYRPTEGKICGT